MGKKSDNTEICEIVDSSNNTLTDSNEIAAYLNRHFSTIGQNLASKLDQSTVNPKEYLTQSKTTFKFQKVENKKSTEASFESRYI